MISVNAMGCSGLSICTYYTTRKALQLTLIDFALAA